MTADDVLDVITKHSKQGDWHIHSDGCVRLNYRRNRLEPCPVCWTGTQIGKNPSGYSACVWYVGPDMGLTRRDWTRLADAADNNYGCDRELRAKLLEACYITV